MSAVPQIQLPGGGMVKPIYYPPIEFRWIVTILIVFFGAVSNRLSPNVRQLFVHPIGFFITALAGVGAFQVGFAPGAFAILFFLLSVWATQFANEGFLSASNSVDWVTNSKRWYVEKVLKERPLAIQEKNVSTYPVQD